MDRHDRDNLVLAALVIVGIWLVFGMYHFATWLRVDCGWGLIPASLVQLTVPCIYSIIGSYIIIRRS